MRTACLLTGGAVRGGGTVQGVGGAVQGGVVLSITGSDIINPPCEQNDWQTGVKTLPCPKLHLRAVISPPPPTHTHIEVRIGCVVGFFVFISSAKFSSGSVSCSSSTSPMYIENYRCGDICSSLKFWTSSLFLIIASMFSGTMIVHQWENIWSLDLKEILVIKDKMFRMSARKSAVALTHGICGKWECTLFVTIFVMLWELLFLHHLQLKFLLCKIIS